MYFFKAGRIMKKSLIRSGIIVYAAITSIVIFSCSTAQVKEKEREEKLIDSVSREAESGNMDKALEIYEKKEGNDPLLYSILLINNGRIDEAGALLSELTAQESSNVTALFYLSLVCNLKGDRAQEKALLERIIALEPDNTDANASLGRIYASEKKYREAEGYYRKALSAGVWNEEASLGYGRVLLSQKKNDEALKQYDEVIKNNPDNMLAYIDRAYIKSVREDYSGAESDLDQAVRIDPGYVWNYLDRGRSRLYGGRYEKAAEDFSRVLSADSSVFIAYAHRAEAYEGSGRDDLAIEDYRKVLELREDYAKGYVPFALQLFRKGDWKESASYFQKALKRDKSPEFMMLCAAAFLNAKDKAAAEKIVNNNIGAIPRENLLYHVSRVYVDPYYETIAVQKINEEKKSFEKMKGMFYLAVYYDTFGKNSLSEKYYTEIINSGFPETMEYRMSSWRINKKG